jgi:fructokinase
MTSTPAARFVVFGEALTDFIREGEDVWRSAPGGSCWNVARAAARLGVPTGFAGGVSDDAFGEAHLRLSREAGLDLRFTQQLPRSPFLAMVVERHPPRYFFVGDDSADLNFDPAHLPAGWLDEAELVHFGCISLVREPLGTRLVSLAEQARAAGKRICFDPNYRNLMGEAYRPRMERMAGLADFIKVSEEDLGLMFPGDGIEPALARLRALAPRADLLVTLGARGMELRSPGRTIFQPAFPVEVADTVGAGDSSMAAWMAGVLTRPAAPPEEHLRWAAATAALVCTRSGAYAPTRQEVEAFLAARPR